MHGILHCSRIVFATIYTGFVYFDIGYLDKVLGLITYYILVLMIFHLLIHLSWVWANCFKHFNYVIFMYNSYLAIYKL